MRNKGKAYITYITYNTYFFVSALSLLRAEQSAGGLYILAARSTDCRHYPARRQRIAESDHRRIVGRKVWRIGNLVKSD